MKFYVQKKNLRYFEDYLKSVVKCIPGATIVPYPQGYTRFDNDAVFVQVIPKKVTRQSILLNTEQLTRNIPRPNVKLWIDYSSSNIQLLRSKNKLYLPYPYNPSESWEETPTYDVAMVGTMSPKRMAIFNALKENNVKCIQVKGWGNERDKKIAKSRILLNVHHSPTYKIFETLRCDRWIMSRHVIISEQSEPTDDPLHQHVIFVPYKRIVRKVKDVLSHYDETKERLFKEFDLDSIQNERAKQIEELTIEMSKHINGHSR